MLSKCRSLRAGSRLMLRPSLLMNKTHRLYPYSAIMSNWKPLSIYRYTLRNFCVPFKRKKISLELTERLKILQRNYEKDPKNINNAYLYFRELNRVGMYQTVVRLYQKQDYEDSEKLRLQYDYAVDHLEQVFGLVVSNQLYHSPVDKTAYQSVPKYLFKQLFQLLWRCLGLFVFVFIVTMIIKNINSRSLLDMYNFDLKKANDIKQRLSDVKGIDEIKEEVENVIKMVKNPEKYTECGAKLHKGLLLFGQPGTGKTLLARAIAGEAATNFIYCTGSDFDEMFVGVGAKRIRELFEEAKKNSP